MGKSGIPTIMMPTINMEYRQYESLLGTILAERGT